MWQPPWAPRSLGKLIFDEPKKTMLVWRVQKCEGVGRKKRCAGPFFRGAPQEVRRIVEPLQSDTESTPGPDRDFRGDGFEFKKGGLRLKTEWAAVMDWFKAHPEVKTLNEYPGKLNKFYFAFPTKEAAEEWIGKGRLTALARYGYKLETVPAKRVWLSRSKRQVIFVPAR